MAEQTATGTANQQDNRGYNMASALEVRLNTKPILDECEIFLSGKKMIATKDKTGKISIEYVSVGTPKMNDLGVQSLINRLSLILNNAVVQGNYEEERYRNEIGQIRKSIAKDVMLNLNNWAVKESEYMGIIDSIMTPIKAFLSRTVGNKERESYDNTIKVTESNTVQQKGRFAI